MVNWKKRKMNNMSVAFTGAGVNGFVETDAISFVRPVYFIGVA
jgi:hypothetical protein